MAAPLGAAVEKRDGREAAEEVAAGAPPNKELVVVVEPAPAPAPPNNEVGAAVEVVVAPEVVFVATPGVAAGAAEVAGVVALFPKRDAAGAVAGACAAG